MVRIPEYRRVPFCSGTQSGPTEFQQTKAASIQMDSSHRDSIGRALPFQLKPHGATKTVHFSDKTLKRKGFTMAQFSVRQRYVYYEDFSVEAESAEDAIQMVDDGEIDGDGPEFLETTATYLTDGISALAEQPDNATLPE